MPRGSCIRFALLCQTVWLLQTTVSGATLDHFGISPVASPQVRGIPFEVTITAREREGSPLSDYQGEVSLSARTPVQSRRLFFTEIDLRNERVELVNPDAAPIDISGWRLDAFGALAWSEPTAAFVFPPGTVLPPFGLTVVVALDSSWITYPRFKVGKSFYWHVANVASPLGIVVRDEMGSIIDLVAFGTFDAATLAHAPTEWIGNPLLIDLSSSSTYLRIGTCDHDNRLDWTRGPSTLGDLNPDLWLPLLLDETPIMVEPPRAVLVNGTWTGMVTVSRPGNGVRLRADSGAGQSGESNPFDVGAGPALTLSCPQEAFEATAGLVGNGTITVEQMLAADLEVSLKSSLPTEILVPDTVVIPAGASTVTFAVTNRDDTILDGTRTVVITATAPGYLEATEVMLNHDNETASLTLSVPATVRESDGVMIGAGRVSLDQAPVIPVTLNLLSDNAGIVGVPPVTVIQAGAVEARFDLVVTDNSRFNAPESAVIAASVIGWGTVTETVTVLDNESTNLTLSIISPLDEGSGVLQNVATVSISGVLTTNLVVTLESQQPAMLALPTTVTIPAGLRSVPFPVTLADNASTDGLIGVDISARAPGFGDGQQAISVRDNDVHHFSFGPLPPAQFSGEPFAITMQARAIDDTDVAAFTGTITLSAAGALGTVSTIPEIIGPFSGGTWSGTVRVDSENHQARLVARGSGGQLGSSDAFDILTASVWNLPTSDLVYHPGTGKILAGALEGANGLSQCIVEIDPVSGQLTNPIPIEDQPGPLALSDDGRYLYVGLMSAGGVARVDLQSRMVDLRFALGADEQYGFGPFYVEDMAVVPGSPRSLVVSRRVAFNAYGYGVAVYDDGVPRPGVVGPAEFANEYRIAIYDSPTRFYSTYPTGLRRLTITPDGVGLEQEFRGPEYGGDLEAAAGFLFSTGGDVFAAREFRRVGTLGSGGVVRPDATANRVYVLGQSHLTVFDLFAFRELGTLRIPGDSGPYGSLISCGSHGVAFRDGQGKLLVLRSTLVPTPAGTDLAVSQTSAVPTAAVGSELTYEVTVTNRGPSTAANCVLADVLPLDATLVSATPSQGDFSFTNGVLSFALGSLGSGAQAHVTMVIRPTVPGELVNTVYAVGGSIALHDDVSRQTNVVTYGSQPPIVTRLSMATWDLGYDPARHRLYLGVDRWIHGQERGVRPMDLNTGLVGEALPLQAVPRLLAVTQDGSYLYVAVQENYLDPTIQGATDVQRINLQSGSVEQQFQVVDHFGQQHTVLDLQAVPGLPSAVAIARAGPQNDIAIYEAGVQTRMSQVDLHCRTIEFDGSGQVLFGATAGAWGNLYRMTVSESSIDAVQGISGVGQAYDFRVEYSGGLLFANSGEVIDAETLLQIAALPVMGLVQPDADEPRIYYLAQGERYWQLTAFETQSLSPLWSYPLPTVVGMPLKLVSCGPDLLAFRTTADELVLLNTSLMSGDSAADLSMSLRVVSPSVQVGSPLIMQGTVTNRGPALASQVRVILSVPGGLELQSSNPSQGSLHIADDGVIWEVGEVPNGGTSTVTLEFTPTTGGTLRTTAHIEANEQDPNVANNAAAATVYVPIAADDGIRLIEIPTSDLVYDAEGGVLFASVPSLAGPEGNSILAVNPETGELGNPVWAGAEPGRMASSSDGEFLYVALDGEFAVRRFQLDSLTSDIRFSVDHALAVADMEVLPGDSSAVAVSRRFTHGGSPQHAGVVVYDDGVARAETTSVPVFANVIAFSETSDTLYAYDNETSAFTLSTLAVGPEGVSAAKGVPDLCFGSGVDIEFAGGRLYATSGAVIDPLTDTLVGRCEGPGLGDSWTSNGTLVEPDPEHGLIHFLVPDAGIWKLMSYDMDTFAPVGALNLPNVMGTPSSLVRAGAEVLAFRTSANQIFLCRRDQIQASDLVLTHSVSPVSPTQDEILTYSISVSNDGPAPAADVIIQDVLPRDLVLGEIEAERGVVQIHDGIALWIVGVLGEGETVSLMLQGTANVPGLFVNQVDAQTSGFDPNPQNNSSALQTFVRSESPSQGVDVISVPANQIAYDPVRERILVGLSGTANGIVSFDLATRSFGPLFALGAEPRTLAVTDDGQYLYVGVSTGGVARIVLASGEVDLRFEIGTDWQGWPLLAEDMHAMPGHPETVAIAQSYSGVGLYDNGVPRPDFVPQREFGGLYPIGFGSESILYSALPFTLRTISVNPAGLALDAETEGLVPDYETGFEVDQGLLFFYTGRIVDPSTSGIVGEFPVAGLVAPNVGSNRVCFLSQVYDPFSGPLLTLRDFDLTSLTPLWSIPAPPGSGFALSLIRLGNNGYAFLTDAGRLFVVGSEYLSTPSADLSVTLVPDLDSATVNGRLAYTCIVSNAGPWTSSGVMLTSPVPDGTTFVSATSSQGACTLIGGEVVCELGTLATGTSASVNLVLSPMQLGATQCSAQVFGSESDPVPTNNSAQATINITPPPLIAIAGSSIKEGSLRPGSLSFTVSLSAPSSDAVTVEFSTGSGTATAGADYEPTAGSLVFDPGVTNRLVSVRVYSDNLPEPDETIVMSLSNPVNATLLTPQATGTILNDDFHILTLVGTSVPEGNVGVTDATFELRLSVPSTQTISVDYSTADGTAVAATDYMPKSGTMLFPPGVTTRTVSVSVLANPFEEPDKFFFLVLRNPTGGFLGANEVKGIIVNDDIEASLVISDVSLDEAGLRFRFPVTAGRSYAIERSTDFGGDSWTRLSTIAPTDNAMIEFIDSESALYSEAFYRVLRLN